ncbi:MAG: VIT1/CCC1 transporter family protein [Gammaproteobacteria bacterium]
MFKKHEPDSAHPIDILRHYLSDVIYGAHDGIITTFAVVVGAQGAKLAPTIVIILGFVNLFADGISMGASRFLSIRAGAAAHNVTRGFIEPLYHGFCTFFSFFIFGLFPLITFLIPRVGEHRFWMSCVLTGITLFCVGSLRIFISKKDWFKGGLEMLILGSIVAFVSYGVGFLINNYILT